MEGRRSNRKRGSLVNNSKSEPCFTDPLGTIYLRLRVCTSSTDPQHQRRIVD